MGQAAALLYAFNRGVISPLGLSRTDLKVQALSAEVQTNWMPRELGSMMLRPGTQYIDTTNNSLFSVHVPFIKAITDTAIIELTDSAMRVRVQEVIVTRVSVATAITNGNFTSNITGWTQGDESGATSQWISGPFMSLMGNGSGSRAIRSQLVSVASGDASKQHALRIVITKGYVTLRVGTALGDDSYINKIVLGPGTYSLAFTPTASFYIQVTASDNYTSLISSINIEAAGAMVLPTPWVVADLRKVRTDQSEDIIFAACIGYAQYKIERIGNAYSWAVCQYLADDGPFQLINTDNSITMIPGALSGDTTLSCSVPYFKPGHIGCLFRVTSVVQDTSNSLGSLNQSTSVIEVTGVGSTRTFSFQITGTWTGTISLQQSVGSNNGPWTTVNSYTTNQNTTELDGLDNQLIYYRFSMTAYVSGSAIVAMQFSGGGITGICRVTGYVNNQTVNVEVLESFGAAGTPGSYANGNIVFSVNPSNNDTITLNGVTWTFKTSGASGTQTNIQGSLTATVTQLISDLTASTNASLTPAFYSGNGAAGTQASGYIDFTGATLGPGLDAYNFSLNGVQFGFAKLSSGQTTLSWLNNAGSFFTNIANFLNASTLPQINIATYSVSGNRIVITYDAGGSIGNSYSLSAGTVPNLTTSGISLSGGVDIANGVVITYKTIGTGGNAYTLAASAGTPSGLNLTGGVNAPTTGGSSLWSEGEWSFVNGYPTAPLLYEGRLWWFGNDSIDGSVSDAFASYDDTVTGDSGPISRTIGSGPVENICWALALQRLLLGGENAEFSISSSYLNEALTPTDFNIKSPSTRGSSLVAACKIDTNGVFAQRGDPDNGNSAGTRLIQMSYQGIYAIVDYQSVDLSELAPEIVQAGILKIAVQRKIDTRIHCVLADGTVGILVYDPVENVKAWIPYTTNGTVEDVIIMPGFVEDKVYYVVNRMIEGASVRYFERWSLESQCVGGNLNYNADCATTITNGSPSTVISAPQLAGQNVVVWADGKDIGTVTDGSGNRTQQYTLDASGNATVPSYTNAVVGLGYTAQFQSAKLAYAAPNGAALNMVKSVDKLGLIMANTHYQGLQYGPDFNTLDNLPLVENGTTTPADTVWASYDQDLMEFNGEWDTDSRVCLQAQAPRPCNILSCVIGIDTVERV